MKPMPTLVASLALVPGLSWADAVNVSVQPRAMIGKGLPALIVEIEEPIAGFELKLKRSDGKDLDIKGGGRVGQKRTIDLPQPEGSFTYKGELLVNLPRGESASMPLEFQATLLGTLRLNAETKDQDVPHRKLHFSMNHPIEKVHLRVLMDSGKWAIDNDIPFNKEAPDTPLEVTWPDAPGKVMTVNLEVFDTETFHRSIEFSPWVIDIPHQEVNFDTGKWDVRPGEKAKLDESYQKISDAVAKYGQWADVKLYIAGHTDTVGGTDYNRGLSLNRAKSIGAYFRRAGIRIPIFYEGFGEEALLVQTPDETDEPRNRRAEYFISIGPPDVHGASFAPRWRSL
jgi:outer membrane protein OmpA-like peptidoglycan-associated protein